MICKSSTCDDDTFCKWNYTLTNGSCSVQKYVRHFYPRWKNNRWTILTSFLIFTCWTAQGLGWCPWGTGLRIKLYSLPGQQPLHSGIVCLGQHIASRSNS